MAETFADLGKIQALKRLRESVGGVPADGNTFKAVSGGFIRNYSAVFLEGTDFDLTYFPLKHLGYKCATIVSGGLYASLAHPKVISVRLGVSAKLDFPQIKELWEGLSLAAKEHGYESSNLDLIPSRNGLAISISATGETLPHTEESRSSAKSKDLICISGCVGAAYLGQQILERENKTFSSSKKGAQPNLDDYKMIIGDYLKPEINPGIVKNLEEAEIYPSYGFLVNNGLSDAVKRLVEKSGLGAKIYANMIPFEGNSFQAGKELDIDPVSAAMNGGDDCQLLFTVPISLAEKFRRDFQTFDIIGHLAQSDVGAVLVTPEGVELTMTAQGW